MAKQSNLEKIGFERRNEHELVRNDISKKQPYDASHPYAISTKGQPLGKGSGHGGHGDALPGDPSNRYSIDIENGGGEYDINGRPGVDGGRKWLESRSLYNKENKYGIDIVIDTDANIEDGQFFIK